jgi:hypothetical protein
LVGDDADDHSEEDAKGALPEDGHEEPFLGDICGGALYQAVDADEEEGEADAIVAASLSGEHVLDPLGDAVAELTVADNRGSEDRIGRRKACCHDQSSAEVCLENPVDEKRADEPAESHDRAEHHGNRLPVAGHVEFWQLDADGEDLDTDDDAGGFLQNLIAPSPASNDALVGTAIDIADDWR